MLNIVKLICERTEACRLRHNQHFILSTFSPRDVLASTKYRLQVEKIQIENIRIFYFKDKSTRIFQPLTCVGLLVSGVSISEEASWYRQQKKFQTFLI